MTQPHLSRIPVLKPHLLLEYEQTCGQAGVNVTPLTLTLPSGSAPTATGGSSGTQTTVVGSNPSATVTTAAGTVPAGTVGTAAASTNTAASGSNPLSHNGAGVIGVSAASVAGAVGVVMAALL